MPEAKVTVTGLGSVLPERVLTNHDLERLVDTSDEWIVERTGIRQRRLAAPGEAASDLGAEAARRALADAGLRASDVDLIVVSTATPDHLFPSTACLVQKALGARRAAAMDVLAACTGFIYALAVAEGAVAAGRAETVLVVATETLSRITNYRDRSTCILFGDGAGAVVVRRAGSPDRGLLSVYLAADGEGGGILSLPAGGSRLPATAETVARDLHYIHMDGPEVFRFAVEAMVGSFRECVRRAGLGEDRPGGPATGPGSGAARWAGIDLVVPHQANARIVDTAVRFLRIPRAKVFHTIELYGNMSSASIPVSLDAARRTGRLGPGDTVVLVAFGAGMTYGGAVLRWDEAGSTGQASPQGGLSA